MSFEFSGEIWFWKGPAPFHFVNVPDAESREIKEFERHVTYGWGMNPVRVRIGSTEWTTALWPKDGKYIVPIKAAVRKAERLTIGDKPVLQLDVG
jgi:Domain of unknown function (DUF1905)